MLASAPSQHLESDCGPRRNPKCESTSKNHALEHFHSSWTRSRGRPVRESCARVVRSTLPRNDTRRNFNRRSTRQFIACRVRSAQIPSGFGG